MMLYDFRIIGLLAYMKINNKTLDLLFKSNCKVVGPITLREIMKSRLTNKIEDKDLFIDVWKHNQDIEKLSKTAQKALTTL